MTSRAGMGDRDELSAPRVGDVTALRYPLACIVRDITGVPPATSVGIDSVPMLPIMTSLRDIVHQRVSTTLAPRRACQPTCQLATCRSIPCAPCGPNSPAQNHSRRPDTPGATRITRPHKRSPPMRPQRTPARPLLGNTSPRRGHTNLTPTRRRQVALSGDSQARCQPNGRCDAGTAFASGPGLPWYEEAPM